MPVKPWGSDETIKESLWPVFESKGLAPLTDEQWIEGIGRYREIVAKVHPGHFTLRTMTEMIQIFYPDYTDE